MSYNYVVVKFLWKDGFEDTHEVPRGLPIRYYRRRETRGGKREDIVSGYTTACFVKIPNLQPITYEEV